MRRVSWRTGRTVDGVVALRQAILRRPELFVSTMTEKLLTYALGRGVDHHDMPAVRDIVRQARPAGLSVLVARRRHRQQRAVSDEKRRRAQAIASPRD